MSLDKEIDDILRRAPVVIPSAAFASNVMNAIQKEARSGPPLAFPWKFALPGLSVWLGVLIWVIASGVLAAVRDSFATSSEPDFGMVRFLELWRATRATWILYALIPTVTIFKLSTRVRSNLAQSRT